MCVPAGHRPSSRARHHPPQGFPQITAAKCRSDSLPHSKNFTLIKKVKFPDPAHADVEISDNKSQLVSVSVPKEYLFKNDMPANKSRLIVDTNNGSKYGSMSVVSSCRV